MTVHGSSLTGRKWGKGRQVTCIGSVKECVCFMTGLDDLTTYVLEMANKTMCSDYLLQLQRRPRISIWGNETPPTVRIWRVLSAEQLIERKLSDAK